MRIRSLSHVGITVSDFQKAVKWYYDMFGFRLISEDYFNNDKLEKLYPLYRLKGVCVHLGFLRAPKGGVVEIFEFSSLLPGQQVIWNTPGATHFTLDVKNVYKWYNRLKAKGVYFFSEPQHSNGADWVFLKDPDGNLIELIDLKVNYPIIRYLGGVAGNIMAKNKFKKYYSED